MKGSSPKGHYEADVGVTILNEGYVCVCVCVYFHSCIYVVVVYGREASSY